MFKKYELTLDLLKKSTVKNINRRHRSIHFLLHHSESSE